MQLSGCSKDQWNLNTGGRADCGARRHGQDEERSAGSTRRLATQCDRGRLRECLDKHGQRGVHSLLAGPSAG